MKRIISIVMVLLIVLGLFTGCLGNKYNARIYSHAEDLVLSTFLEENKVLGAFYPNPDYVDVEDLEDDEYPVDKYYQDETSPRSRIFIINDSETFDSIFQKDKIEVDFSKEVVYLYVFSDDSPREYLLDDISLEDGKMTICCKLAYSNKKDSGMPSQRCLAVVMDKNDATEVEFIDKWNGEKL